jgi:hypothetical protein
MIPREILKKIRQIELRTNRIVSATLVDGYFGLAEAASAGKEPNFDDFSPIFAARPEIYSSWNAPSRNGMDCKNRGNASYNSVSDSKNRKYVLKNSGSAYRNMENYS